MSPELPLRGIHLPDPVGWWPPAPGWWMLAIIMIATMVIAIRWYRNYQRRMAVYYSARHELEQVKQRYQQSHDTLQLSRELSVVLRRVAISIASREQAAGLIGESWLAFLDNVIDKPLFDSDIGRQLLTAPYQPIQATDVEALLDICEQWLMLASRKKQVSHA